MLPLIPILAVIAILGGTGTLIWYNNLSKKEQRDADEKANEIALSMFNKALNQLTKNQLQKVLEETKKELKG